VRVRGILIETNKVKQNTAPSSNDIDLPSVDTEGLDVIQESVFTTLGDGVEADPLVSYDISGVSDSFIYFSGSINRGSSPSGLDTDTFFGGAVSSWDGTIVIGAATKIPFSHTLQGSHSTMGYGSNTEGAIFIFSSSLGSSETANIKPEGWIALNPIQSSDIGIADSFGNSVSIYKDYIAVGAPGDNSHNGSVYIFNSSSSGWSQTSKLTSTHDENSDSSNFGWAVSVFDDKLLASAPVLENTPSAARTGAVFYFKKDSSSNSWNQVQEIRSPSAVSNDAFGWAVDLSGSLAVASSPFNNTTQGRAIVLQYQEETDSWSSVQIITESPGENSAYFGHDVSISGRNIIIGSPQSDTESISDNGAAYIFEKRGATWTQVKKLSEACPDGATDGNFGKSVSIFQNIAVVGAPKQEKSGGSDTGFVYAYISGSTGWTAHPNNPLRSPTADSMASAARPEFGFAVQADGEYIIAGDPRGPINNDANGNQAGNAVVFNLNSQKNVVSDKSRARKSSATAGYNVVINNDGTKATLSGRPENGGIWADVTTVVAIDNVEV